MASWRYAFMFAGSTARLLPQHGIDVLREYDFEIDEVLRHASIIDDEGHIEYTGEHSMRGSNREEELKTRLGSGEQFQSEFRNRALFFSLSIATGYPNPYVMIGWSNRLFANSAEDYQRRFVQMLRRFARLINADYVVIVDDPPDYFEDKFIEIDGRRFLDNMTTGGKPYEVRGVWIANTRDDKIPDGVSASSGRNIGDGFTCYQVD
jgi:hypothetical protein